MSNAKNKTMLDFACASDMVTNNPDVLITLTESLMIILETHKMP
jgi:Lhr-like helicase